MGFLAMDKDSNVRTKIILPRKWLYFMKLSCLTVSSLLITLNLLFANPGASQDIREVRVSVALKNEPLKLALKQIEAQSIFKFAYTESKLQDYKDVFLPRRERSVKRTLEILLAGTNLGFVVKSNTIILVERRDLTGGSLPLAPLGEELESQIVSNRTEYYKNVITGIITNEKGEPLVGATITEKGTSNSAITKEDGRFSINTIKADATLLISYVGYDTKEIAAAGQSSISVSLIQSNSTLNDVVVVGYGLSRRKDVTGAVASVSSKDFNQGIVTNPLQQIQGRVAGLVITSPGGDPNSNPSIRLRGQTSLAGGQNPLIVVDGIPLDDANQLSNIPPADIESYDVLKDASATSIFGSRGANGVILITTKRGRAGQTRVEYNAFAGAEKQAKFFDLINGDEWRAANPGGVGTRFDNGGNTDWQRAVTRTANSHSHNIAISGGANGFNYRGSVSYINQESIIRNAGKNELGVRFNAQQKTLNNKLDINLGLVSTITNRKFNAGWISNRMASTSPALSIYKPDGSYNDFSFGLGRQNAVQGVDKTLSRGKDYLTQMYATADYELIKNFKVGVLGALTNFNSQGRFFLPKDIEGNARNIAERRNNSRDNARGDVHLNYLNNWGGHNVNATAVYEYNYFTSEGFSARGEDFGIPFFQDNNLATGDASRREIRSGREEYKLISFLGRVNYNFNEKYYVTAALRRDGSSKFGVNNRWGYFPSASVAWRISKEDFLNNVGWISDLKLRVGYGETGNSDAITPYASFLTYAAVGGNIYNPSTGTFTQVYFPNQNANPDLQWEKRIGRNIGLDFALLDNRLTGDINVFNDRTENLLFDYTLPSPPFIILPPAGGRPESATVLANVGTLSNKGVELSLNYRVIDQKDFSWTLGGQIGSVRTRVESLAGSFAGFTIKDTVAVAGFSADANGNHTLATTYLKAGYTPYVFYLAQYEGVDGDGKQKIGTEKRYIDPSPKFTYAFNNNFGYKNWNLSVFFRGVAGQKAYNNALAGLESGSNLRLQNGQNVTRASLTNGIKNGQLLSDLWLENASYLRLDNASLGYTFRNISGMQHLRLFVAGNNLFVITKFRGLDPEIEVASQSGAYISSENRTAKTRAVSVGLSVGF
jgi:iron complex outermembrane receptor protein